MKHIILLMTIVLLPSSGSSQTRTSDSQTQQQMLDELRAIRRELHANTTLQLLLADLQITQTSLDRATERRDTLKAQVAQVVADEDSAQADLVRIQKALESASDANEKGALKGRLAEVKEGLRKVTSKEQVTSQALQDAEDRFKTSQAQLAQIQSQLNDLTKKLDTGN